jgi:hypothetical protein
MSDTQPLLLLLIRRAMGMLDPAIPLRDYDVNQRHEYNYYHGDMRILDG